jgi:hypothetical protein
MEEYDAEKRLRTWKKDELLHRTDGPALIKYYQNGNIKIEKWYQNGKRIHDDVNPCVIDYYPSGNIKFNIFYRNPDLDEPAFIAYYDNNGNTIEGEMWGNELPKHRDHDMPALIKYDINGNIILEQWYQNGLLHRVGQPASIKYNRHGNVVMEIWALNDFIHNTEGPAIIYYNNHGGITRLKWFINGLEMTEEDFNKLANIDSLWSEQESNNFFQYLPLEMLNITRELYNNDE